MFRVPMYCIRALDPCTRLARACTYRYVRGPGRACDWLTTKHGIRPNQGLFGTHKVPIEGHWLRIFMKVQPSCIPMQLRRVSAASVATFSAEAVAHRHRKVRISQVDRESLAELRQSVDIWTCCTALNGRSAAARAGGPPAARGAADVDSARTTTHLPISVG